MKTVIEDNQLINFFDILGLADRSRYFRRNYFDVAVNAKGSATFSIYGFGHRLGLSQHGARMLASRGKNFEEILRFYYHGIELMKLY
jgi:stage II sporulation protein D